MWLSYAGPLHVVILLSLLSICPHQSVTTPYYPHTVTDGIHPVQQAKRAYALASIEQLVPVLSESVLRDQVFPFCAPHLSDSAHRETYESAHSVMLAIFASGSQSPNESDHKREREGREAGGLKFTQQLVPFYANCLIDNSSDGKLSTSQLCLAYAALVCSACNGDLGNGSHTLTWFCISSLLTTIRALRTDTDEERLNRLHLALMACVPSVPLEHLPRLLDEIRDVVVQVGSTVGGESRRRELGNALFEEILERVGDRQKGYAMKWWLENREQLMGVGGHVSAEPPDAEKPLLASRL